MRMIVNGRLAVVQSTCMSVAVTMLWVAGAIVALVASGEPAQTDVKSQSVRAIASVDGNPLAPGRR